MYRLKLWNTQDEDKWSAEVYEYLGDRLAIWHLWHWLTNNLGRKHVAVYNLDGVKQKPENGLKGLA